jgi:hypothetical protein
MEGDYGEHVPKALFENGFRRQIGIARRKSGRNSYQTNLIADVHLIESRQLDQVILGDAFYGVAGFAPGAQAAGDDEHFESQIL